MPYYVSLQYSAIQKTVLRHDRLWSIAGISQTLAWMNEVKLYEIATVNNGEVVVAGGGKFTAKFKTLEEADVAKLEIIAIISDTLPMLEYQVSEITPAINLQEARDKKNIIKDLNDLKNHFRGYAFTHNPHLELCSECGEYPAVRLGEEKNNDDESLCAVCRTAKKNCLSFVGKSQGDDDKLKNGLPQNTTLERIYREYYSKVYPQDADWPKIPLDFEHLFPQKEKKDEQGNLAESEHKQEVDKKRMAVWFSDLNNMNDKVPIWLDQEDAKIVDTFDAVKEVNVEIIVIALSKTFDKRRGGKTYLPFRIIVAGGDDLRIVMDEKYILQFAKNLSDAVHTKINGLKEDHPLHSEYLKAHNKKSDKTIKPYGFGGSFVVTALHTPFKKIHELCEDLMSKAKEETKRLDNSVNWCILSEDETTSQLSQKKEKPIFISTRREDILDFLSLADYLKLIKTHRGISPSHRYQIIEKIAHLDGNELENALKAIASKENDKDYTAVLTEKLLRDKNGKLIPSRIVMLFELMSIGEDAEARK